MGSSIVSSVADAAAEDLSAYLWEAETLVDLLEDLDFFSFGGGQWSDLGKELDHGFLVGLFLMLNRRV